MLCPINNLHNEGSLRFVKVFAKSESIRKAYCPSLLMGGTSIAKPPSALSTSPTMEPTYNSAESDFPSNRLPCTIFWVVAGLLLVGLHLALAWLSSSFDYETPILERPILSLVLIELVAGAVFMTTIWGIRLSLPGSRALMTWVIVVGALLRAIMMTSTPMLETDFYRYMWDGAVLANGISPYRYSPEEAAKPSDSVPIVLQKLAHESGNVIAQVNHPELRTIYPPVAQVFFAAAYILGPWSMLSLRIVLAVFDAATFLLLLTVLRGLNLSTLFVVIYWWNPLVVKEIFNSAHMDVIAVPLGTGRVDIDNEGAASECRGGTSPGSGGQAVACSPVARGCVAAVAGPTAPLPCRGFIQFPLSPAAAPRVPRRLRLEFRIHGLRATVGDE